MLQYFDRIQEILNEVEVSEASAINQTIDLLTEANLNQKGIYIFGAIMQGF